MAFFLSLKWMTRVQSFMDFNSEMEDDWHKSWRWGQRSSQSSTVWGSRPWHVVLIINELKAIWPDDLLYMCTDCFEFFQINWRFDLILLRSAKLPAGFSLSAPHYGFYLRFSIYICVLFTSGLPVPFPRPAMSPETRSVERIPPVLAFCGASTARFSEARSESAL